MVDNFNQISEMLEFTSDNDFYLLDVIQRKKEIPDLKVNSRKVKTFYITSKEYLFKIKDEIVTLCKTFNARACIRLNVRHFDKVSLKSISLLSEFIASKQYGAAKNVFEHAAGKTNCAETKLWIIDIDEDDVPNLDKIKSVYAFSSNPKYKTRIDDCIVAEIPSKTGLHLITTGFDSRALKLVFPRIIIHKDNPTNIYIP